MGRPAGQVPSLSAGAAHQHSGGRLRRGAGVGGGWGPWMVWEGPRPATAQGTLTVAAPRDLLTQRAVAGVGGGLHGGSPGPPQRRRLGAGAGAAAVPLAPLPARRGRAGTAVVTHRYFARVPVALAKEQSWQLLLALLPHHNSAHRLLSQKHTQGAGGAAVVFPSGSAAPHLEWSSQLRQQRRFGRS